MFPKEKKPAFAVKIFGQFLGSPNNKKKECVQSQERKKGDKFLTRTLIIVPMLRLAGSATSFSLLAAFIPTTLLGGGSNRQPSCSGLSLRNQTVKNHTFRMQQVLNFFSLLATEVKEDVRKSCLAYFGILPSRR